MTHHMNMVAKNATRTKPPNGERRLTGFIEKRTCGSEKNCPTNPTAKLTSLRDPTCQSRNTTVLGKLRTEPDPPKRLRSVLRILIPMIGDQTVNCTVLAVS